jgi:uncharacterized protein (TIGR02246 family)
MKLQKYFNSPFIIGVSIAIAISICLIMPTRAQSLSMEYREISEMVRRQARAWESQNVEAIIGDFAPDAVFIAAGFRFEGQQQIEQAARDYFRQFDNTSVEIKRIIIDGDRGAVEWDWRDRQRQSDREGFAEDAIIFEMDNGKIVYWREYIEKKQL